MTEFSLIVKETLRAPVSIVQRIERWMTQIAESDVIELLGYGAPRSYTSTRPMPVPLFSPASKAV
jgi:hypothetical protein